MQFRARRHELIELIDHILEVATPTTDHDLLRHEPQSRPHERGVLRTAQESRRHHRRRRIDPALVFRDDDDAIFRFEDVVVVRLQTNFKLLLVAPPQRASGRAHAHALRLREVCRHRRRGDRIGIVHSDRDRIREEVENVAEATADEDGHHGRVLQRAAFVELIPLEAKNLLKHARQLRRATALDHQAAKDIVRRECNHAFSADELNQLAVVDIAHFGNNVPAHFLFRKGLERKHNAQRLRVSLVRIATSGKDNDCRGGVRGAEVLQVRPDARISGAEDDVDRHHAPAADAWLQNVAHLLVCHRTVPRLVVPHRDLLESHRCAVRH